MNQLFKKLEQIPQFRVDFLYYLQLANNSKANIINYYFARRQSKSAGGRRNRKSRLLFDAIRAKEVKKVKEKYQDLVLGYDLLDRGNFKIFDCLSDGAKEGIINSFNDIYFSGYRDWNRFYDYWDILIQKRDCLMHFDDRRNCVVNNEDVIKSIALLLLPSINEMFIQTVESHIKRSWLESDLGQSLKCFKNTVRKVNSDKKIRRSEKSGKKQKDKLTKPQRRNLKNIQAQNIAKRDRYFKDSKSSLKLYNFNQTYNYIGKKHFQAIRELLTVYDSVENFDFDYYRSIFELNTKINLLLAGYLEKLKGHFKIKTDTRKDNFSLIVNEMVKVDGDNKFVLEKLKDIRNGVAHNLPIYCFNRSWYKRFDLKSYRKQFECIIPNSKQIKFAAQSYSFLEISAVMLKIVFEYLGRQSFNDLYTKIRAVFEKQKYCLGIDKVRVYSCSKAIEIIDKRKPVKKAVGRWRSELEIVKKALKK